MPFLRLKALKVSQPLGAFYLTKVSAEELIKVCYSSELRPKDSSDDSIFEFEGSQRIKKEDKLKQIGRYIDSVEAAFPNSIILAANYTPDGQLVEDDDRRWYVDRVKDDFYEIIIPTREKLAAIVDGQHRLDGFLYTENSSRWETELVCAIYIDLPLAYQAYLFSNINYNQTPVNKSLSYILYGYNLDDETSSAWSPEKLAVFISRQLNSERDSPFYHKIKVAPQIDKILLENAVNEVNQEVHFAVSTATIVEGILNLITTDARRDRDELGKFPVNKGRYRRNLKKFNDDSPLRSYYLDEKDVVIRKSVENFFKAAIENLAKGQDSFLFKTIGIQALFDVLKENLKVQAANAELNISGGYFRIFFTPLYHVKFNNEYLLQSSAIGRGRLRNFMLYAIGYKTEFDPRDVQLPEDQRRRLIKVDDKDQYDKILSAP